MRPCRDTCRRGTGRKPTAQRVAPKRLGPDAEDRVFAHLLQRDLDHGEAVAVRFRGVAVAGCPVSSGQQQRHEIHRAEQLPFQVGHEAAQAARRWRERAAGSTTPSVPSSPRVRSRPGPISSAPPRWRAPPPPSPSALPTGTASEPRTKSAIHHQPLGRNGDRVTTDHDQDDHAVSQFLVAKRLPARIGPLRRYGIARIVQRQRPERRSMTPGTEPDRRSSRNCASARKNAKNSTICTSSLSAVSARALHQRVAGQVERHRPRRPSTKGAVCRSHALVSACQSKTAATASRPNVEGADAHAEADVLTEEDQAADQPQQHNREMSGGNRHWSPLRFLRGRPCPAQPRNCTAGRRTDPRIP
jgi:hypothetical protein